ncbi:MAG: peptidoglycan bridge formation glycyltransferase FemA/FemB family protein [Bacteroidales bacterium]|nr:peptidoglycan bridge formation glycyltransferase FemA/FemB family protein [Bacteroidales bacterium]
MSSITKINRDSAIPVWNQFLFSVPFPVPFSFNPSLFDFYSRYFHWKPYYLILSLGKEIVALLPLVDTGKSWASLPHFTYGGLITGSEVFNGVDETFLHTLISIIKKEKIGQGFYGINLDDLPDKEWNSKKIFIRTIQTAFSKDHYHKMSAFLTMPGNNEELLRILNSNLKRKIKKAGNSGFELQIGGKELIPSFYKVYSSKVHKLGTPAYSRKFFQSLMETYQFGESRIFLITRDNKLLGTSLLLSYQGFCESVWFATCKEAYKDYISDFLHWNMISYAFSKKAKVYSFGRSTVDSSVHQYKSHWPVLEVPIYQIGGANIRNKKWLATAWENMPFLIAKEIGPLLVKHIY